MARVLICGGRDFHDAALFSATMDYLDAEHGIDLVIEGGATGADALAKQWALDTGKEILSFPIDRGVDGRTGEPIRDKQMLDEGRPDLVVAFPGGEGTTALVRQAKAAGLPVVDIAAALAASSRLRSIQTKPKSTSGSGGC